MLYSDYTEKMLEIEDAIVKNVEIEEGILHIFIEMKRKKHKCKNCEQTTDKIHDYREQTIKDLAILGRKTYIHLRKRRYICPECGKKFIENTHFLSRYQRMTKRMSAYIVSCFGKIRSVKSIAEECNISQTKATNLFNQVEYGKPKLVEIIAIDEFKGNAGGEKFQCILTDPIHKKVLDIVASRKSEPLSRYFSQYTKEERSQVKYIVMDMSSLFRNVARNCFPHAKIVADKFHICRQITWALERVRKDEQKRFATTRRKYFKKSRWILLKRQSKLNEEEKQQLENMLNISEKIRKAYLLKEKFYEFMESKTLSEARTRLLDWNMLAGKIDLPEFNKCITTFFNWNAEILAAFETGYSNGYTEGMNNKIKVLKRISFGVRNFDRFRNRILYLNT